MREESGIPLQKTILYVPRYHPLLPFVPLGVPPHVEFEAVLDFK